MEELSIFGVGDLDRPPVARVRRDPNYPRDLEKAGVEGTVTVVFIVTEEGYVEDPRVESSSHPGFENEALRAISRWRYNPGEKDGKPVRTHVRQPFSFRLSR